MDQDPNTRSLNEFKRNTDRVLAEVKQSGRPTVLTVDDEPDVVIMDAQAWLAFQGQLDRAAAIAGIADGLADAKAGRVEQADEVFDRLEAELG